MSKNDLFIEILNKLEEALRLLRIAVVEEHVAISSAPVDEEFMNQRLDRIYFGPGHAPRLQRMFKNYGEYVNGQWVNKPLVTVRDLVALRENELLRCDQVGRKAVERIKAVLAPHGLHLGMDVGTTH